MTKSSTSVVAEFKVAERVIAAGTSTLLSARIHDFTYSRLVTFRACTLLTWILYPPLRRLLQPRPVPPRRSLAILPPLRP